MRKMDLDAEEVFLNGNCGNLYKIFVSAFPKYTIPFLIVHKDEPMHIVTKIEDKFYDITGETSLEKYVKYLNENNSRLIEFQEKDFNIKQISVADRILDKMCDMYKYNEEYNQSEIRNQMYKLLNSLNDRINDIQK